MNAITLAPQLARVAQEIKRVCASPPENNLRGIRRERFEHSYILQQEDNVYLILRKADVDAQSFMLLSAVGQHFMFESEIERFKSQSAFDGNWARRKPGKARAQIADDLDVLQRECARLIGEVQTLLSKGDRSDAAHYALCAIKGAAKAGVRIAALIELAGYDTACGAKLAALIQLVDNKLEPALKS